MRKSIDIFITRRQFCGESGATAISLQKNLLLVQQQQQKQSLPKEIVLNGIRNIIVTTVRGRVGKNFKTRLISNILFPFIHSFAFDS